MLKKFGGKEKRRIFAIPIEKRVFERTRVLRKTVRVSDDLHRDFERNFKKTEKSFADSKIKLTFATPFEKRDNKFIEKTGIKYKKQVPKYEK